MPGSEFPDDYLRAHVLHVSVDEEEMTEKNIGDISVHVYQLYHEGKWDRNSILTYH